MTRARTAGLAAAVLLCLAGSARAGLMTLPQSTSFEQISTSEGEPFSIGDEGEEALFAGDAFSGFLGVAALYNTGSFAWMVSPEGTGTVDFASGATAVEFFATASPSGDGDLVITVLSPSEAVLATASVSPGEGFQPFSFSGDIGRIRFENLSTGVNRYASIDDFSFAPGQVPEPGSALLLATALGGGILAGSRVPPRAAFLTRVAGPAPQTARTAAPARRPVSWSSRSAISPLTSTQR